MLVCTTPILIISVLIVGRRRKDTTSCSHSESAPCHHQFIIMSSRNWPDHPGQEWINSFCHSSYLQEQ